jgi:hypothetical protein
MGELKLLDIKHSKSTCIKRMKVWRGMIAPIHSYLNAVKVAQRGHSKIVPSNNAGAHSAERVPALGYA